jgi:hypothetical protein
MVAKILLTVGACLLANKIAPCAAVANANSQSARSSSSSGDIPDWKLGLLSHQQGTMSGTWWESLGLSGLFEAPSIASSPAQSQGRCPILKLPSEMVMASSSSSWLGLKGHWYTSSSVEIANFDQSFFSFTPWHFNMSLKTVNFRAASTWRTAVRTKVYTDKEMLYHFDWKPSGVSPGQVNASSSTNSSIAAIQTEDPINIAMLDCVGNLMYVARSTNSLDLIIYSREGFIIASAIIEAPVLRMQWVYPPNNYLIATVEAPGIDAKIQLNDIPKDVEFGGVVPFGVQYAPSPYKGSSQLMEDEFRWVIPVAVQAHWIFLADRTNQDWGIVSASWFLCTLTYLLALLIFVGALFFIYRCVYPHYDDLVTNHYGKISENHHLAIPECPPHRDAMKQAQYGQQFSQYGSKSMTPYGSRYGSVV